MKREERKDRWKDEEVEARARALAHTLHAPLPTTTTETARTSANTHTPNTRTLSHARLRNVSNSILVRSSSERYGCTRLIVLSSDASIAAKTRFGGSAFERSKNSRTLGMILDLPGFLNNLDNPPHQSSKKHNNREHHPHEKEPSQVRLMPWDMEHNLSSIRMLHVTVSQATEHLRFVLMGFFCHHRN